MLAIARSAGRCARAACAAALLLAAVAPRAQAGPLPDLLFSNGFDPVPITAPANTWTFVPFADSFCGNQSTTGLGINPSPTPNGRLLLFLTGGGGCWNTLTCITLQTAANFNTGYGPTQFANDLPQITTGFFDRNDVDNPFRNDHYVYVPYCSGDVHAGNNTVNYGGNIRRHAGYTNLTAFLERIVPTFPQAPRVVLVGASAGGFGVALNWARVQQAFGNVRVDMIDDSGTLMPASIVPSTDANEIQRFTNWGLASTIPPGCAACPASLANIYGYNAAVLPNSRGALLSYRDDNVIRQFYLITSTQFTNGLNENLLTQFDPFPARRYYIVAATGHVLLVNPLLSSGGVTLRTWVNQMVTDDPAWANVNPP